MNAHKVTIKLTKRMLSLCVNSLLHGTGIGPTTPAWRKQKCKQFLVPTPNSNSEHCKKGALGALLKVDVIEGDGNCLFRAISYEVTLSQDHHGFFRMSACGILQTDLCLNQGI